MWHFLLLRTVVRIMHRYSHILEIKNKLVGYLASFTTMTWNVGALGTFYMNCHGPHLLGVGWGWV